MKTGRVTKGKERVSYCTGYRIQKGFFFNIDSFCNKLDEVLMELREFIEPNRVAVKKQDN